MSDERSPATTPAEDEGGGALDRFFGLRRHGTNVRTEVVAGVTTFLAMAYIIVVNPGILSEAGVDFGAVFVATCVAAAGGTLIMGLWARYPIAQAPGMGLNAFFAFTVVLGMGIPWETALAGTFVSGVIFFLLTLAGAREAVINAIPMQLKLAVGAGIGLFIAFVGLQGAGIVVLDEATLVSLGDLTSAAPLLAMFGVVATGLFLLRGMRGGVFYGIVVTAVVGMIVGQVALPEGVVSAVPSVAPTFGVAFGAMTELLSAQMVMVVFTMLFVDFFDTAGTLIAVANQAELLDEDGRLPRAGRALTSDAIATMGGAVMGTSTTTSYIESAAGVGAGGRTGLTSVVTGGLFLLALPLFPLVAVLGDHGEITAPALIIVGVMMARGLGQIKWDELEFAIPAFVTVIAMPLTYSIANGIALGLFLYPLMMLFKGRGREIHPVIYALAAVFAAYFIWFVE